MQSGYLQTTTLTKLDVMQISPMKDADFGVVIRDDSGSVVVVATWTLLSFEDTTTVKAKDLNPVVKFVQCARLLIIRSLIFQNCQILAKVFRTISFWRTYLGWYN
jgi:hypothetical protein